MRILENQPFIPRETIEYRVGAEISLPRDSIIRTSINGEEVKGYLARREFSTILGSENLFKALFCQAFPIEENSEAFRITKANGDEGETFFIEGQRGRFLDIWQALEKIQKILFQSIKAREDGKFYVVSDEVLPRYRICQTKTNISQIVKLSDVYRDGEETTKPIWRSLKVTLPKLITICGGLYSRSKLHLGVATRHDEEMTRRKVSLVVIQWKTEQSLS